jgi:hypothetical protein
MSAALWELFFERRDLNAIGVVLITFYRLFRPPCALISVPMQSGATVYVPKLGAFLMITPL